MLVILSNDCQLPKFTLHQYFGSYSYILSSQLVNIPCTISVAVLVMFPKILEALHV